MHAVNNQETYLAYLYKPRSAFLQRYFNFAGNVLSYTVTRPLKDKNNRFRLKNLSGLLNRLNDIFIKNLS